MKKKLLFLFPAPANMRLAEAARGEIPRERLYGLLELRERGWNAEISDARWIGSFSGMRQRLRRLIELPSVGTFRDMRDADIIVVKDSFSTTLLAQARIADKPLVYLDAMFGTPRKAYVRQTTGINLKHAAAVCCYSKYQADDWAKAFDLPPSRIDVMPYCIDCEFYPRLERDISDPPYVISVGRDPGRDFATLIAACENAGVALKLVTLPYLLPENAKKSPHVEILQNLSYQDLFDLYAGASMAVIPLKKGITYPSGIRAMLESAALGVPTIVSETMVLPEYLSDEEHVLYVEPEVAASLSDAIRRVLTDPLHWGKMADQGSDEVRRNYSTESFADRFEAVLSRI